MFLNVKNFLKNIFYNKKAPRITPKGRELFVAVTAKFFYQLLYLFLALGYGTVCLIAETLRNFGLGTLVFKHNVYLAVCAV